jgi:hypothetical protein
MQSQARNLAETWQAIDELDFSRMRAKLLHGKDSGWTTESVARAEYGYRLFLKLTAKYPGAAVVPNEEVDRFWHAHILDTQRYMSDCERLFGSMLHHNPYVGIDGAEDEKHLHELAAATRDLMAREFGAACADKPAYCAITAGSEGKAAYCAVTAGSEAKAAYCAVSSGPEAKAAYCAVSSGLEGKAAYCAVSSGVEAKAAYCAVSSDLEGKAAYCAVSSGERVEPTYRPATLPHAVLEAHAFRSAERA